MESHLCFFPVVSPFNDRLGLREKISTLDTALSVDTSVGLSQQPAAGAGAGAPRATPQSPRRTAPRWWWGWLYGSTALLSVDEEIRRGGREEGGGL